jgi:hypothetical protein
MISQTQTEPAYAKWDEDHGAPLSSPTSSEEEDYSLDDSLKKAPGDDLSNFRKKVDDFLEKTPSDDFGNFRKKVDDFLEKVLDDDLGEFPCTGEEMVRKNGEIPCRSDVFVGDRGYSPTYLPENASRDKAAEFRNKMTDGSFVTKDYVRSSDGSRVKIERRAAETKRTDKSGPTRGDKLAAEGLLLAIKEGRSAELSPEEALQKAIEYSGKGARVIKLCSHCMKLEDRSVRVYPKCGRCKTVYYCDAICQKADWPRHKPFCLKGGEGFFETEGAANP